MAKINLLDFSKTFSLSCHGYRGDYWSNSTIGAPAFGGAWTLSSDFEVAVINKIVSWSDWKACPENILLLAFFKKAGKLSDNGIFYSNINSIKRHSHWRGCDVVYTFCRNVLKGRLPSGAEGNFLSDIWDNHYGSRFAYKYAKYVIRGRLPVEYEKGCHSLDYLSFLETKGIEISDILINSTNLSFSYYKYFYHLPEVVHNFMLAMQLSGDGYASAYFRQRTKDDVLIKNRLKMVDPNKTVKEVLMGLK
jgi:hypothetical protein